MSKHKPHRSGRARRLGRQLNKLNDALRGAATVVRESRAEVERLRAELAARPVVYRGPLAWAGAWWRGTDR